MIALAATIAGFWATRDVAWVQWQCQRQRIRSDSRLITCTKVAIGCTIALAATKAVRGGRRGCSNTVARPAVEQLTSAPYLFSGRHRVHGRAGGGDRRLLGHAQRGLGAVAVRGVRRRRAVWPADAHRPVRRRGGVQDGGLRRAGLPGVRFLFASELAVSPAACACRPRALCG